MGKWIEGTVIGQRQWTDRLYSLQVKADLPSFEAGQFIKLALAVNGEMVARPYSFVNAPKERPYEFYYIVVPEGPLSPALTKLEPLDNIYFAAQPSGFLVLSEVPDCDHLWMLSTGTGIGPFLSILKTEAPWKRFKKIVLVHAVRHGAELTYRDQIEPLLEAYPGQLQLISFVSREERPGALTGRIPEAITDGRLEKAAGLKLAPEDTHVMMCGNPEMISAVTALLKARGMKKHRRRDRGHITVENYW
ncbi:MAG TPA: ferredoxin--NADP reductase [Burkholderiales bacterium]|nr:ferredoxin--NADP reductase [Burkholderiales bacterium]